MSQTIAAHGSWSSPVSGELLVASVVGLSFPIYDKDDTYWIESRPMDAGRDVIVKRAADGTVVDLLPQEYSARTLVHEYGGLCYAVRDSIVYFSNFNDQRLYRIDPGTLPRAITDEPPSPRSWRYADPVVTPDGAHIICVRERHEDAGVTNDLVLLSSDGSSSPRVLAEGHDFFAAPALALDGRKLAWISWDHPRMPWDGTALHEAVLNDEFSVTSARIVCGSPTESVLQPKYGVGGTLHYISDRTGWWNLYAELPEGVVSLAARPADCAVAPWIFGTSSYALSSDGSLVTVWSAEGVSRLGVIAVNGELTEIPVTWTYLSSVRVKDQTMLCLAGSATEPISVVEVNLASGQFSLLKVSRRDTIDVDYLSSPQPIEFPTEDGLTAHALYYPPVNPDFSAPAGELPPLIVAVHGGPTSSCTSILNYSVQYWTSRGFAVVDVNYGGSTGYGREYRQRLNGNWGVVDLDDCVNAALFLAASGWVDVTKLLIHGGSAGGYTTLCALTFRDSFAAGASYFGVGDLGALASDTHKFESRYLDGLVGPWPERKDLYKERSPIFHTDILRTPVILFQGLEDAVVPPAQAQMMAEALERNGVPYAYIAYEGEQHGFRKAENIIRSAEAELYFYGKILGFEPADLATCVDIRNADSLS